SPYLLCVYVVLVVPVSVVVYILFFCIFVFFFFQAEDGIRDDLVTGVQTCALPIWAERCSLLLCSNNELRSARPITTVQPGDRRRSEERRVGKECRSRWSR